MQNNNLSRSSDPAKYIDEKALSCADAVSELHENLSKLYEDRFNITKDDYEDWLGIYERRIESLATSALVTPQTNTSRNNKAIKAETREISILMEEMTRLTQMRDDAVKSGAIKKWSDSYYAMTEAIDSVAQSIRDAHESIGNYYIDNFNNTQEYYDNWLTMFSHMSNEYNSGIEFLEAKGRLASANYYKALMDVETQNLNVYEQELSRLEKDLQAAMDSGEIIKFSDAWYDMYNKINGVKEAIDASNVSLAQYAKTMREVEWGKFDYLQDRIAQIVKEANFLIDLMSNEELYENNGQLNNEGLATLGLRAENYDVYMSQADKYAKEILSIDKQIARDPYNTDLISRRETLLGLQQDSIASAEKEKQAIKGLVEEGIKRELDSLKELIDAYNESLDSAKDLYDYQKKAAEQTKKIAEIQKQLGAYQNDNSEETRARVQKLRVSLEEAQDNLRDTQYDRFVSDSKKLLSNLYDEYEAVLNERLDNIDALMTDMIKTVNDNAKGINSTLLSVTKEVGYTMTKEMRGIWANGGQANSVVSTYYNGFNDKLTTISTAIDKIAEHVYKMSKSSDAYASSDIADAKAEYKTANASVKNGWKKEDGEWSYYNNDKAQTGWKEIDNQWYYFNSKGKMQTGWIKDKNNWYYADNSGKMQTGWVKDQNDWYYMDAGGKMQTGWVQDRDKWYYMNASGKMQKGWVEDNGKWYYMTGSGSMKTGWLQIDGKWYYLDPLTGVMQIGTKTIDGKQYTFGKNGVWKGYKTGGAVDYTGLAMVHGTPTKPELVFNAQDSQNLIDMRDALRVLAEKSMFSNIGNNSILKGLTGSPAAGNTVGAINVSIGIDHVEDYNDFVSQLQKDTQFEKMVMSMTVDKLAGRSPLQKNKYAWK